MDAIRAYLEKAREMWEELDKNKKIGAAAGAVVLLLVIVFLSMGDGETSSVYRPLYTDLDLREAGQISARLQEMNQDFSLGGDGTIVLVPEEDRLRLRTDLSAEGFPKTGLIGYEVFDEIPLGITDFLQQVRLRQALATPFKRTGSSQGLANDL